VNDSAEVTLGQIASLITKGTTPTTLGRSFTSDGVNFVKVESISDDGYILRDRLAHIDSDTHDLLARSQIQEGDILFSIAGAIGRTTHVKASLLPANTNQALAVIRIDESAAYPRYVYYYLRSQVFQQHGLERVVQTAQANVSLAVLRAAPIVLPPRTTQRAIADSLSAFDDLIDNNRRQIALLEQMAQAMYREWFVHFRYPGHEDDELVDSPLGPIPAGWSLTPLGELGSVVTDSVDPSAIEPETPAVGLEHIPRHSLTLAEWGRARDLASRKTRFSAGDVLFGKIRPYFHKVCVAPMDGIASTDAIVVRPRQERCGLVTMTMFSDDFVAHAVTTSSGTKMPRADWKVLREWLVPIPPDATLSAFEEAVASAVDSCNALAFQCRALAELRDLLLPKLVTGAIDVSKLDLDVLLEVA
jgi:type I restriction enzyme S subunit